MLLTIAFLDLIKVTIMKLMKTDIYQINQATFPKIYPSRLILFRFSKSCKEATTVALLFYLQRQQFLMSETRAGEQFEDTSLSNTVQVQSSHKLPRIEVVGSRQAVRSKNEKRKTSPLLPNIKNAHPSPQQETINNMHSQPQLPSFTTEIEERLRMVLENVNQGEEIAEDSEEGEEVDFQQLIQQNKQKLKQQKMARSQTKQGKTKSKTVKAKNQNSIYQKRMKEYRQVSTENRFIQKRKEAIAIKQQAADKVKALKAKQDNHQQYNSNPNTKNPQSRPKFSAKQRRTSEGDAALVNNQSKTADLFDNIHNFLQNPIKARAASELKRHSKDSIKELEDKIKQINDKLGLKQVQQKNSQSKQIEQKTVLDWKRLQYNRGSNFRCLFDSNFQKQVDRIGSLQQKNANILSRFLDHQKTLVQLNILRKVGRRPEQKTN